MVGFKELILWKTKKLFKMEQVLLKNRIYLYIMLALVALSGCNKSQKENVKNNIIDIQNFMPEIVKGKKYSSLTPMSSIHESNKFVVKQYDYSTFIIFDKVENVKYCFKYSGGDNVYLTKNIKPTTIFLLKDDLLPMYAISFKKNDPDCNYDFLKFEYINGKVYKVIFPKKERKDILSMTMADLKKNLIL
ncbi:hypothetical protein EAG08_03960 [Chryseobacterium sp. 3008163]|nr:hypothetical protein EAG08_03960 [Chryseobacterium sp. 3008163]